MIGFDIISQALTIISDSCGKKWDFSRPELIYRPCEQPIIIAKVFAKEKDPAHE